MIPVSAGLGLLAALFWGGGDFSGGMGAKSAGGEPSGALRVILTSHSASFLALLGIALLRRDAFPHGAFLLWGLAAGVAGGLSLTCFYIALASGAMGASAAISGLLAAAIPVLVSMAVSGPPGTLKLFGFVLAGVAIWMIAVSDSPGGSSAKPPAQFTLLLAIGAGAGFGVYFVALKIAGVAGLVWPMATARVGSLTTCSVLLCYYLLNGSGRNTAARLSKRAILWALSTALLDTSGNLFFIAATRSGRLDVAAVLASLYPATTILLAGLVLKERFSPRQFYGMAVAVAAVVMITL